jgi:alpha-tubulin suppressor-like RCC1 family protein
LKQFKFIQWLSFVFFGSLFLAGCNGSSFTAISTGDWHACAITQEGIVQCWGDNRSGQLGNGSTFTISLFPTTVKGISHAVELAAGGLHTCALTSDGKSYCWGENKHGELGNGTNIDENTPVETAGISNNIKTITAGTYHTCVVDSSDQVYCWGNNAEGELGDGTITASNLPVKVSGLPADILSLAAHENHTCAWEKDGGVWCWGEITFSDAGASTQSAMLLPEKVNVKTGNIQAIASGLDHTCEINEKSGVECWGRNSDGQLGNGNNQDSLSSVEVTGLANGVKALAKGNAFNCALTSQGGVLCWGDNYFSELGDGTNSDKNIPVVPTGLSSGIKSISAGYNFACALTETGEAKCWGTIDDWNSSNPHTFQ